MTDAVHRSRVLASVREGDRQALIAAGTVLVALLLLGALFPEESLGALHVWLGSRTFNHCFLVVPLGLYLVWQRRNSLQELGTTPDLRAAFFMLGLAALWLTLSLLGALEIEQFVVLTMVQVTLFGVLGWVFYRKLAGPFLFLYFLVPSGSLLIPFLQAFTARFAVAGLHLLGIPVFSNGAVIDIPAGTFVVEEACAGLRFLVAAVAFGVFFALITYQSWWRRTAFVALSFVVPIIANGFRALGLIAAAQWLGNPTAALADHILYGWIFFSLILVLLVFAGQKFSDTQDGHENSLKSKYSRGEPIAVQRTAVVSIALLLAAATAPLAAAILESSGQLAVPQSPPKVASPWHKMPSLSDWKPIVIGPTRSFSDSYVDGAMQVDRFIALYGTPGRNSDLVRSNNRDADERMWNFDSSGWGNLPLDGRNSRVRVSTWTRGSVQRTVWSFYVVNGKPVAGLWNVKRDQLLAYLSASHCVSAYVAVSAEAMGEATTTTTVAQFLRASEPLRPYLCRSTRVPEGR